MEGLHPGLLPIMVSSTQPSLSLVFCGCMVIASQLTMATRGQLSCEQQATLKPRKYSLNWELLRRDWFGYLLWCDRESDTLDVAHRDNSNNFWIRLCRNYLDELENASLGISTTQQQTNNYGVFEWVSLITEALILGSFTCPEVSGNRHYSHKTSRSSRRPQGIFYS
jgi:hypothetical protein